MTIVLRDKADYDPCSSDVRCGYYIKQLDTLFVLEGKNHTARCKIENGTGTFDAYVVNLDDFSDLESDGEKWFYQGQTSDVNDFRLALLFWCYFQRRKLERV